MQSLRPAAFAFLALVTGSTISNAQAQTSRILIINMANAVINYRTRVPSKGMLAYESGPVSVMNEWHNADLQPGDFRPYSVPPSRLTGRAYELPQMQIEYDDGQGHTMSYSLPWKMVNDPDEFGAIYYFAVENGIFKLLSGTPPSIKLPAFHITNNTEVTLNYSTIINGIKVDYKLESGQIMQHSYEFIRRTRKHPG